MPDFSAPDFSFEQAARDQGARLIAGIDEAGRGPLAGPVVAAAVILPDDWARLDWVKTLNDSKKLSATHRDDLFPAIMTGCLVGVGMADPAEIDQINILAATMKAMERAVMALPQQSDWCLIDGNRRPGGLENSQAIVKGDSKSLSIAAASIIAKVTRDRIMQALDDDFPAYGWAKNAGYPTPGHRAALRQYGITPHHRKSFAPVRDCLPQQEN